MKRIELWQLELMLSQVKDWKISAYEVFFEDDDELERGFGFSTTDKENIFYGPIGWAGSSLDGFGFDMLDIKVGTNPEKIVEDLKSYMEHNVEFYKGLIEDGLFVEEHCGWEHFGIS